LLDQSYPRYGFRPRTPSLASTACWTP
jgi:hypothetical protein